MTCRRRHARLGFSLVECVVVIAVIAIAVPGLVMTVRASTTNAIDQQRRVAGAWLASSVLETVQADAASTHASRGFSQINGSEYLSDPTDGLYARLSTITAPYLALGFVYEVGVGSPKDLSGAEASPNDVGALREVLVTVTFTDQSGHSRSAVFRTIVANI